MQKIWTFKDNENAEIDNIDISKTYKATGKFYDDVDALCKLYNLRVHPALKPIVYNQSEE